MWHLNEHVRGRHDFTSRVATLVIFAPRIIFTLIIRKIANWIRAFAKSWLQKQMLPSSTADTNDINHQHFKITFWGVTRRKRGKYLSEGRGRGFWEIFSTLYCSIGGCPFSKFNIISIEFPTINADHPEAETKRSEAETKVGTNLTLRPIFHYSISWIKFSYRYNYIWTKLYFTPRLIEILFLTIYLKSKRYIHYILKVRS